MLLQSLLTVSFALSGLAAPAKLQRRGADEVVAALGMVKASLDKLDTSVKNVRNGTDTKAIGNVATMSDAVGKSLKMATAMVMQTDEVDLFDALTVSDSADELTASVKATTGDLVQKKPVFKAAGLDGVVMQMLVMQKQMSGGLSDAVTEKLPALAQPFAGGTKEDIDTALDTAIKAYMPDPATPSPQAGGNSNGTARATGNASGTSSASPNAATGSSSTSGSSANGKKNVIDLHARGASLPLW